MHLAVQKGRVDVVNLLLEYGDTASVRNHRGDYPSDVAIKLNFASLATKLQSMYLTLIWCSGFHDT